MTMAHSGGPTQRHVVGNISLSLDGRTNGPGGEYDMGWVAPHAVTDGSRQHLRDLCARTTTVLLGRRNYQGFSSYWPAVADDEGADPRDREFSRWFNQVDKIVFSRTLTTAEWQNAQLVAGDPASVVRQLRVVEGGDIAVLASASIIRALLAAGELDRLSITLCPEIAGGGSRLFDEGQGASSWSLRESAPTESGAIYLLYELRRQ